MCRGVSSFSNDAAHLGDVLTPRLGAALAASVALHAAIAAGLDPLFGPAGGGVRRPAPAATLHATLRNLEDPVPASGATAAAASPPSAAAEAAGAAPHPILPGPQYYRTRELDVPPGIMVRVEPEYPEAAARRMLSGKVRIRLLIDETGAVERVEILSADPPGFFESSVQRAFGAARFSPGMKDGAAVKAQLMLEVAFDGDPSPSHNGGPSPTYIGPPPPAEAAR